LVAAPGPYGQGCRGETGGAAASMPRCLALGRRGKRKRGLLRDYSQITTTGHYTHTHTLHFLLPPLPKISNLIKIKLYLYSTFQTWKQQNCDSQKKKHENKNGNIYYTTNKKITN
jgi:hypothetical protein